MRFSRLLLGITLTALFIQNICTQGAPPPAVPDTVAVEPNISYGEHKENVLDIFQLKAGQFKGGEPGKRPGALFIHGGGWVNGTKEAAFEHFVLPYVERGFVVASVEYRLARAAPAPAAVTDALTAAVWFHDHAKEYNVDPKRIITTGNSAGGHLALMVAMTPKSAKLGPLTKVAAVVNFFGITDVEDQLQGENMREYATTWIPPQEDRFELARRLSPITYVRKDLPPILTIHGSSDETVPYEQGVSLTKALRDVKDDAEMISIPGGKHGFPPETMAKLWPQIFEFLQRRGILK